MIGGLIRAGRLLTVWFAVIVVVFGTASGWWGGRRFVDLWLFGQMVAPNNPYAVTPGSLLGAAVGAVGALFWTSIFLGITAAIFDIHRLLSRLVREQPSRSAAPFVPERQRVEPRV